MGLGPTAVAIGTTTGRTTGTRASSGRQACMMPTSKPTSLTCWPRPARLKSTEGTEQPQTPSEPVTSGSGKRRGCRPPIRLRRPQQPISAAVGRSFFLSQSRNSRRTSGTAVSTNHGLGRRRASTPSPNPTLLWMRIFLLFKRRVWVWAGAP